MLLPAVERRGEIRFYLGKSLPYGARLALAFVLMAAGIVLQLAAPSFNGAPFVVGGCAAMLAGVSLLLVRGYENKVREVPGTAEWRPARRMEIDRILELNKEQVRWDQDFFDITSGLGLLGLIMVAVLIGGAVVFANKFSERFATLIALDAAVLLLPFWITGVRSILKNDRLIVKIKTLLAVEKAYTAAGPLEGVNFLWQLQTAKATGDAGDVPHDIKAMLQFENAPATFLGLQMQVSINSVQGTDYPYFYCVLVARPELGLLKRRIPSPGSYTIEPNNQGDVDVLVVRQTTTKKSGYHTNNKAAANVFLYALGLARQII